jgi:hypothetical protein
VTGVWARQVFSTSTLAAGKINPVSGLIQYRVHFQVLIQEKSLTVPVCPERCHVLLHLGLIFDLHSKRSCQSHILWKLIHGENTHDAVTRIVIRVIFVALTIRGTQFGSQIIKDQCGIVCDWVPAQVVITDRNFGVRMAVCNAFTRL